MCNEICNSSTIGFSKITNNSFNRFDSAMDYIENRRSTYHTRKAVRYKITRFLSNTLNICPSKMIRMALESVNKINK